MNDPRLQRLAEKVQTPFYYYDMGLLEDTLCSLKEAAGIFGYNIHYAMKANANTKILQMINKFGFGADCVSGNEIRKAMQTGFAANQIVFAGVGKTDEDIRLALTGNICCLHCESEEEIGVVDQIAASLHTTARIAIRINPEMDANTHPDITTGTSENKFGILLMDVERILSNLKYYKNICLAGVHMHIGSQILDLDIFRKYCLRVNEILGFLHARGITPGYINLGGGLGVDYLNPENNIPDFNSFFAMIYETLKVTKGQHVHFEFGRAVVAQCGSLVTKVLFNKRSGNKNFLVVDAGFNDLVRPALYGSYHKIENISSGKPEKIYDIVGPICETTDCFARDYSIPESVRGDILAIRTTGAYGQSMASTYNMRSLVKAYYSEDTLSENILIPEKSYSLN